MVLAQGPTRSLRRGGTSRITAIVLTAVAGVALQVISLSLPYERDLFGGRSTFSVISDDQISWLIDPSLAVLIIGVVGTALLLFRPTRGFAAGMLFLTGLLFYVADIQGFTEITSDIVRPGYGELISLMSDLVLMAAGMLAASAVTVVPSVRGWLALLRTLGVLASLAAVIGMIGLRASAYSVAGNWPFLLFPIGMAVIGVANSAYLRDRALRFGAGVLFALGYVELGSVAVFTGPFGHEPWKALGLTAAIVLMVIGLAAVVRTGPPVIPTAGAGQPQAPAGSAHPDMTRYLCAAAHLDTEFARQTVQRLVVDRGRAPAPALGIDLGVVLRHCIGADRRHRTRDVTLDMIGLPVLLLALAFLFNGFHVVDLGFIGLLLVLAWVILATDTWVGRYHIAARTLSRSAFDPHRTPALSDAEELDVAGAAADAANVTIYGGYLPFVGSGREQGGWSFALSVLKGKQALGGDARSTPMPFELDDLYEAVRRDVAALELDGTSVRVVVEDRLYVDGQGVYGDDRFLLPGGAGLRSLVSDDELRGFVRDPEPGNRVYRCVRIHGWQSEFVLSMYLNFARVGRGLFIQARYFLLLPLKEDYRTVDHVDRDLSVPGTLRQAARGALRTNVAGRFMMSPFRLIGGVPSEVRRRRIGDGEPSPGFNYGATVSVRELAQAPHYNRYFQQLDRDMIGKIVERQILDSIAGFLDRHNIDTGELEERQTAILNNGLIVSGGSVRADSLAVGTDARSTVGRLVSRLIGDEKTTEGGGSQ